jgi:5-methylcytosine-specific restriction endonuclease McrA
MKNKILELRRSGKSYKQICDIIGCSKGTVAYYCGVGQKEKTKLRNQKNRTAKVICQKIGRFKKVAKRRLQDASDGFQRERINGRKGKHLRKTFTYKDVLKRFGETTKCYISGRDVNFHEPKTYEFDHILAVSKGGSNNIDNLGIACKEANYAKSNLTIEELLQLCSDILEYNGYKVTRLKG